MACCKFHDRLDLKLTTREYFASACGSNKATDDAGASESAAGKPEYCCWECPKLLAKHAAATQRA